MLKQVMKGAAAAGGDASHKTILGRGCDPVMAERSTTMLPPMIGNARIETSTDDDDFIRRLSTKKYDIVFFAPGACRWSAASKPIPGGNEKTHGWGLDEYKALARQYQGDGIAIVETLREPEIVPLLRAALGLPN